MKKYLEGLTLFRGSASWDYYADHYVPSGIDGPSGKQWYGFVSGMYRYAGAKNWTRDERTKVTLITTEKPFLWGKTLSRGFATDFLLPTHEENSMMFFGCKGWSDLLTSRFIERYADAHALRAQCEALRKAGISKADFVVLERLGCILDVDSAVLIDLHRHGILSDQKQQHPLHVGGAVFKRDLEDTADIARWLSSLALTVKAAKSLWKSSDAGKKISVNFHGKMCDYRSKKPKANLHDFLAAVVASCERKNIPLVPTELATTLQPPPGFIPVTSTGDLIKISRQNGWCSGTKYYREGALKGAWQFFFDPEAKALAQYSGGGSLMQVRGPANTNYQAQIPNKLEGKHI